MEAVIWVVLAIPVLMAVVLFWLAFEPVFGAGPVLIVMIVFAAILGFSLSIFAAILLIGVAALVGGIISS
jgi:hypothetical protein